MRKIIILLSVASIALMSCDLVSTYGSFMQFDTMDDCRYWISQNISYKSDMESHGVIDHWQGPEETMRLRTGDCEDYAILLAFLAVKNFNYQSKILIASNIDTNSLHIMVEINGVIYSPQLYYFDIRSYHFKILSEMTLNQALIMCGACFSRELGSE